MQGSSSADYAIEAVLRFLERGFAEDGPKVVNEIDSATRHNEENCRAVLGDGEPALVQRRECE